MGKNLPTVKCETCGRPHTVDFACIYCSIAAGELGKLPGFDFAEWLKDVIDVRVQKALEEHTTSYSHQTRTDPH